MLLLCSHLNPRGACHEAGQCCAVWLSGSRDGIGEQARGCACPQAAGDTWSCSRQWVRPAVKVGAGPSWALRDSPAPLLLPLSPYLPPAPSWELPSPPLCSVLCVRLIIRINVATNNAAGWVLICQTQCMAVIPNTLTFSHEIISIFSD